MGLAVGIVGYEMLGLLALCRHLGNVWLVCCRIHFSAHKCRGKHMRFHEIREAPYIM